MFHRRSRSSLSGSDRQYSVTDRHHQYHCHQIGRRAIYFLTVLQRPIEWCDMHAQYRMWYIQGSKTNSAVVACGSFDRVIDCISIGLQRPQARVQLPLKTKFFNIFQQPVTLKAVSLSLLCNLKCISRTSSCILLLIQYIYRPWAADAASKMLRAVVWIAEMTSTDSPPS